MQVHLCLAALAAVLLATRALASKPTAQDYRVHGLEEIEPAFASFEGRMYAGLVSTAEPDDETDDGTFMFWLFEPKAPLYNDTLTAWSNGGPGCSSMSGCLFEHCPATIPHEPAGYFGIDPNLPLEPNPYAWTSATTMLYVEYPHKTGFSKGGKVSHNETDVGRDYYNFLQNLFDIFEDSDLDLRGKKLNLFGESYAGTNAMKSFAYILSC